LFQKIGESHSSPYLNFLSILSIFVGKNLSILTTLFPTPELLRCQLTDYTVYGRVLAQNMSIEQFWKSAIAPPPKEYVSKSIELLRIMGVLMDSSEKLTKLGKMLIGLPLELKFGFGRFCCTLFF
jgi:HrpA-like RNA helicase